MNGPTTRVAITGTGAVSAPQVGSKGLWHALLAGRSGIAPLDDPWAADLRAPIAARVSGFQPPADARASDRFAQFALVAAAEALNEAGLAGGVAGPRTAVLVGTGIGGETTHDAEFCRLYRDGVKQIDPRTIPKLMPSAAASWVAMAHGATGPVFAVTSACASATHAIGLALHMVRSGMVDTAIAGGSEACLTWGTLKAWEALRVLAPDGCRPFSRGRKGMVLGEGAGILVLERFDRARDRGAPIVAELAGFGMSSDAANLLRPTVDGPAQAMRSALGDGGVSIEDVDHINAHGTGTRTNDVIETQAIARIFGHRTGEIAVTATKSMHGHALGASGALEAIVTAHAVRDGLVPPIAGFIERDPECDLDVVTGEPRRMSIRCALSNSLAFGGLNAVLAFRAALPNP